MNHEAEQSNRLNKKVGFTKFDHSIYDVYFTEGLTKRQKDLLILVLRLTVGCNQEWVELRQADLEAIGIRDNHAKEVLTQTLKKGVLIQKEQTNEYKIGGTTARLNKDSQKRLDSLIHKQLSKSSQKRNNDVPEMGTYNLPKKEDGSSQTSNYEQLSKVEFSPVEKTIGYSSKEREKKVFKDNLKDTSSRKKTISPYEYIPHNPTQRAALAAWRYLEPDKPENFSLYVGFVKRGLPERIFYELAQAIKDNDAIKNKGAYFNKKATAYCKKRAIELEVMNG